MTGSAKLEKLRALFLSVPDALLQQIRVALEFGAESDPGGLPYDDLLGLIEDVAEERAVRSTSAAQGDSAAAVAGTDGLEPEAGPESEPEPEPLALEDMVPPEPEPLILEKSVRVTPGHASVSAASVPRNAMHAFFGPFEALIIDPPKFQARLDGYICSTSLPAIWRLLNEEASGNIIRDAWIKAEVLDRPADPAFYQEIGVRMHAAARGVLDDLALRLREDPAVRRAIASRLGSNAVLGDMLELQTLLSFGTRLPGAFEKIKPLIATYTESDVTRIAEIICAEAERNTAMAAYLQLCVLSYMAEPWQAIRLHRKLLDDGLAGGAESCLIADHLVAYTMAQPEWLDQLVLKGAFRAETFEGLMAFAVLAAGLKAEIAILPGDEALQKRCASAFDQGRDLLTGIITDARKTIAAALPRIEPDASAASQEAPGLAPQQPTLENYTQALSAAAFLAAIDTAADNLEIADHLTLERSRAAEVIEETAAQLATILAAADQDNGKKVRGLANHLATLCGQLVGEAAQGRLVERFEAAEKAA